MTDAAHAATTDTIVGFLRGIGLDVREATLADDCFLPGVRLDAGALVFDRARLRWPGDLLHEAGHVATTATADRHRLTDALDGAPDDAGEEVEATAWAWAALVALRLPAEVLFHDGGYHGHAQGLALSYSLGVCPGSHGLAQLGRTKLGADAAAAGVPPYPHMTAWLRG